VISNNLDLNVASATLKLRSLEFKGLDNSKKLLVVDLVVTLS